MTKPRTSTENIHTLEPHKRLHMKPRQMMGPMYPEFQIEVPTTHKHRIVYIQSLRTRKMRQTCLLPITGSQERKNKHNKRRGNRDSAYHKHSPTTSPLLQLGLGISELGPTHARSVLGGVRSGSKNEVRCSITCS